LSCFRVGRVYGEHCLVTAFRFHFCSHLSPPFSPPFLFPAFLFLVPPRNPLPLRPVSLFPPLLSVVLFSRFFWALEFSVSLFPFPLLVFFYQFGVLLCPLDSPCRSAGGAFSQRDPCDWHLICSAWFFLPEPPVTDCFCFKGWKRLLASLGHLSLPPLFFFFSCRSEWVCDFPVPPLLPFRWLDSSVSGAFRYKCPEAFHSRGACFPRTLCNNFAG